MVRIFVKDSSITYDKCFIAGAEEVSTGDKRSRHSINFHSIDQNDEGTYDCTGIASDKSKVSVSFSIQTHERFARNRI